jgi:cytochrome c biogenesis protein CcdA
MSTAVSVEQTKIWKAYLLPALAALVPLTIAFIGASITGTGTTAVVDSVLGVSGRSSQALGDFSTLLPLGFAFGSGLVASVNPCGFAMLPAYLAMYMGSDTETEPSSETVDNVGQASLVGDLQISGHGRLYRLGKTYLSPLARPSLLLIYWIGNVLLILGGVVLLSNLLVLMGNLILFLTEAILGLDGRLDIPINPFVGLLVGIVFIFVGALLRQLARASLILFTRLAKALLVGGVVTVGFVVLFGIAGLIIGGGARQVIDFIPWVGLIIGIGLTLVGAWIVGGGKIYTSVAQQASSKMGDPSKVSVKGYFLFGLSYGTASLSCTLPIFLAVLGVGVATNTIVDSVVSFVLFGLGMGTVIVVLTIALAVYKGEIAGALRKILPYTQPISATFMILAGTYITFYWLTEGGLVDKLL